MLQAANVSTVPHLSPFRYPGGKTWLVPAIRRWLAVYGGSHVELVEPFAGGASISLAAVAESLVGRATLVELDEDVAAVWSTMLSDKAQELAQSIKKLRLTRSCVRSLLVQRLRSQVRRALQTIVRNRVAHNGILAPGAGVLKTGECGVGLCSRWYPDRLAERIVKINSFRSRIAFINGDGLAFLKGQRKRRNCVYFIDPPYSDVGHRLYRHGTIDHAQLFERIAMLNSPFLLTYNYDRKIEQMAANHGFAFTTVLMHGGSNRWKKELIISREFDWCQTMEKPVHSTSSDWSSRVAV